MILSIWLTGIAVAGKSTQSAWMDLPEQERQTVMQFAEEYKAFLAAARSELFVVNESVQTARKEGFRKTGRRAAEWANSEFVCRFRVLRCWAWRFPWQRTAPFVANPFFCVRIGCARPAKKDLPLTSSRIISFGKSKNHRTAIYIYYISTRFLLAQKERRERNENRTSYFVTLQ